MKKLFATMIMIFLLTPTSVISTEKDFQLSAVDVYQLTPATISEDIYFDSIPSNPVLSQDSLSYEDSNLTIPLKTLKKDSKLTIKDFIINDENQPTFLLSDGSYILARHQDIYDDVVSSQKSISQIYWLANNFKVYEKPYTVGIKEVSTTLSAYSKVTVTQQAVTHHGVYYKVDGQGWIEQGDLSTTNNRMEKVQKMLTEKYNKSDYSIYVKQLSSGNSAGINSDTSMYAASVAKLATLYYVQEEIKDGTISGDDKLTYIDAVNAFDKAYNASGSGILSKTADNKEYTVTDLLKAVAQHSDNVSTNILGYYISNQYDSNFDATISSIAGTNVDMKSRNMSSKTAANIMEAIYKQNGDIISYLSDTEFDSSRISKDISVQVAHKIGDAYDYKHDVAIVYANEPFILSIFTNNASYDDISNIANDVYSILK